MPVGLAAQAQTACQTAHSHRCAFVLLAVQAHAIYKPNNAQSQVRVCKLAAQAHASRMPKSTQTKARSWNLRYKHMQAACQTAHSHRCAFVQLAAQAYASRIPNSAQTQARVRATCGTSICKPYAKQCANPGTRLCNLRRKHTQAACKTAHSYKCAFVQLVAQAHAGY